MVRDANGETLGLLCFEEEPGPHCRQSLTREEARRVAAITSP